MKKVVILLFFTIALFLFCESSLFAQNEIKNEGYIYILENQNEELRQLSHDLLMLHEKEEGKPFSSKILTPIYLEKANNFFLLIEEANLSIAQEILLIRNVLLYETYLLSICPFVEKRWKKKVYQKKIVQLEISRKTIDASLSRIKSGAKQKMPLIKGVNKILKLEKITLNKLFAADNIAHDTLIEYKVEEILITLRYIIETIKENINNL